MGNMILPQCYNAPCSSEGPNLHDDDGRSIRASRPRLSSSIFEKFRINQVLGKGTSGRVYGVTCLETGENLALKVINKDVRNAVKRFENETEILKLLNHPHIVKFHGWSEDKQRFGICTKLCVGGTLVARVKAGAHYSERVAATLLRDIVSAIAYAHNIGIVHRDMKLRNIVFETESNHSLPVIIDWGESCYVEDEDVFEDIVGTPVYLSPEASRERMGWELKKADVWAIGVMAYVMLVGEPPFEGRTIRDYLRRARTVEPTFPSTISDAAKSFIQACMRKSPRTRVSAEEALEMDFLKYAVHQSDIAMGMFMHHRLVKFSHATDLQRLLIDIQIRLMSKEDRKALRDMYHDIVPPQNGTEEINPEELAEYLKNVNPYYCDEAALERAKRIIEATGRTTLDSQSFAQSRIAQKMTQEQHVRDIFTFLDQKDSGYIRPENVKTVAMVTFKRQLSEEESEMIESSFIEHFGSNTVRENDFVQSLKLQPNVSSYTFLDENTLDEE